MIAIDEVDCNLQSQQLVKSGLQRSKQVDSDRWHISDGLSPRIVESSPGAIDRCASGWLRCSCRHENIGRCGLASKLLRYS